VNWAATVYICDCSKCSEKGSLKGLKDGVGNGEEVFPSPPDWGYAGVVSSHSGVRGRVPAKNGFDAFEARNTPPVTILAVPNVSAHPSMTSVPITVLLYNDPLLCSFNVSIKGLSQRYAIVHAHSKLWISMEALRYSNEIWDMVGKRTNSCSTGVVELTVHGGCIQGSPSICIGNLWRVLTHPTSHVCNKMRFLCQPDLQTCTDSRVQLQLRYNVTTAFTQ